MTGSDTEEEEGGETDDAPRPAEISRDIDTFLTGRCRSNVASCRSDPARKLARSRRPRREGHFQEEAGSDAEEEEGGEIDDTTAPRSCAGVDLDRLRRMKRVDEGRLADLVLGFKHTVRESFKVRCDISRPHDDKWKFAPPAVGAILDGNDSERPKWIVRESARESDDDQFEFMSIRSTECSGEPSPGGSSALCRSCESRRKRLLERFDSNVRIRRTKPDRHVRHAILKRTGSLQDLLLDMVRADARNAAKRAARAADPSRRPRGRPSNVRAGAEDGASSAPSGAPLARTKGDDGSAAAAAATKAATHAAALPKPRVLSPVEAARERVSMAEARVASLRKKFMNSQKELKEARGYLNKLLLQTPSDRAHATATDRVEEEEEEVGRKGNDVVEDRGADDDNGDENDEGEGDSDGSLSPAETDNQSRKSAAETDNEHPTATMRGDGYCLPVNSAYHTNASATNKGNGSEQSSTLPSKTSRNKRKQQPQENNGARDNPPEAKDADPPPPAMKKRSWKLCSTAGCTNLAKVGGVCRRHGAKYTECSHEGCANNAMRGGVCRRHGASKKPCTVEGCQTAARQGGLCCRHGAREKRCSDPECDKTASYGGYCRRHCTDPVHLAKFQCAHEGCTNKMQGRGGYCKRHGPVLRPCSREGCTTWAKKGGYCHKHGVYANSSEGVYKSANS